ALESVENPKMTPCPTSTGRPIVVLPKILVAHTEASVHANVSCGSESMRRGDARQACAKLHIEIAYLRFQKIHVATQYRNCVFPAPNAPQIANGIARSSFAILSGCSFQDIFVVCPAIPDRSFTEAVLELDIPVHV